MTKNEQTELLPDNRYTNKPVTIEAIQVPDVFDIDARCVLDDWLVKNQGDRKCRYKGKDRAVHRLMGRVEFLSLKIS